MAKLTGSTFVRYEISDSEFYAGTVLSELQKCVLDNKICDLAESQLALDPDPNNYPAFIQQHAYLAGQRYALQLLLDESTTAEKLIALTQTQDSN